MLELVTNIYWMLGKKNCDKKQAIKFYQCFKSKDLYIKRSKSIWCKKVDVENNHCDWSDFSLMSSDMFYEKIMGCGEKRERKSSTNNLSQKNSTLA